MLRTMSGFRQALVWMRKDFAAMFTCSRTETSTPWFPCGTTGSSRERSGPSLPPQLDEHIWKEERIVTEPPFVPQEEVDPSDNDHELVSWASFSGVLIPGPWDEYISQPPIFG